MKLRTIDQKLQNCLKNQIAPDQVGFFKGSGRDKVPSRIIYCNVSNPNLFLLSDLLSPANHLELLTLL